MSTGLAAVNALIFADPSNVVAWRLLPYAVTQEAFRMPTRENINRALELANENDLKHFTAELLVLKSTITGETEEIEFLNELSKSFSFQYLFFTSHGCSYYQCLLLFSKEVEIIFFLRKIVFFCLKKLSESFSRQNLSTYCPNPYMSIKISSPLYFCILFCSIMLSFLLNKIIFKPYFH